MLLSPKQNAKRAGSLYLAWQRQEEGYVLSLAHTFVSGREFGEKVWGGEGRGSMGNVGLMRVMWEDI